MIRTNVVELSVIPAVAYRQKLTSGGSGVTILRYGYEQPGIASVSKTTGKAIISDNTPADIYPEEAFAEALALTTGLPYKKQGKVVVDKKTFAEEEDKSEEIEINLDDYNKIVEKYMDKTGKLSYELLNKDLIKFANSSKIVREMVDEHKTAGLIRKYIVGVKFRDITGNHDLSDKEIRKIVEMLDNVYPKGVFKELNDKIRKDLSKSKK